MKALQSLTRHLEQRLDTILDLRGNGCRTVGYYPGGYLPEELVLAAGAIPIGLVQGGRPDMLDLSAEYICRWIDPFCRTQIGLCLSGTDPLYNNLDLLVLPVTDNHVRAVADVIGGNTDLAVFPFGVPHMKEPSSRDYFKHGLLRLKSRLEELTGIPITNHRLQEAIALCNRERALFSALNESRKAAVPPIGSREVIALCHGAFLADKTVMIDILQSVLQEIDGSAAPSEEKRSLTRILLTGSTLAKDDWLVPDLIETHGGTVVLERFDEGLRPCGTEISLDDDPMEALADGYFMQPTCPAWFRPADERSTALIQEARDTRADAVIWYHLMYRESFKTESYYFPERLKKETGLPFLLVESDFETTEAGNIGTRIETFLHALRS